jgi:hypothetical protein
MRFFSTLIGPGQMRTRVDESWKARVCMRVSSTLMPRSNENKSCMSVDESWEARVCTRIFSTLIAPVKREQELHETWEARVCMRIFSTLMPRSKENKSCMRVEKREFVWEFSQLSCPGQTRTRVAWELRSESLHENFLNPHALVKREQELHESWVDITASHQSLNQLKVDESRWELTVKRERELQLLSTFTFFDRGFRNWSLFSRFYDNYGNTTINSHPEWLNNATESMLHLHRSKHHISITI